jgi:hypothetical protein
MRLPGQLALLLVQHIHVLRKDSFIISCQTRRSSIPTQVQGRQMSNA